MNLATQSLGPDNISFRRAQGPTTRVLVWEINCGFEVGPLEFALP